MFSPGAVIAVDEPSRIESWLGGNGFASIPIIELPSPVLIVDKAASSFSMPEVPHNVRLTNMQGFRYSKVLLTNVEVKIIDVNCMGKLCDCLGVFSQGVVSSSCSCYSAATRLGRTVALVTMRVLSFPAEEDATPALLFVVSNFTSRRFTSFFCENGCMPADVSASTLGRRASKLFGRAVRRMVERVNNEAGWSVSGWARRGFVRDMNASNTTSNQGQGGASASTQIVSSNLMFHPISIIPNKNANGEDVAVDDLRFSFASLGSSSLR